MMITLEVSTDLTSEERPFVVMKFPLQDGIFDKFFLKGVVSPLSEALNRER